jgi:DnaK suppressor protein
MKPIAPSPALTSQLAAQLRERREELQSLLHATAEAAKAGEAPAEVVDFKDVAAIDTRAQVDEVAQTHAVEELERIAAALRRVEAGTYGQCADCGEVIDERRLRALPATPFCTSCQAIRERPALARR